jgi:hypothetical protein
MKVVLFSLLAASWLPSIASAQRQIEVRAVLNDPVNSGATFQVQTAPKVFNALPLVAEGLSAPVKVELIQDRLTLHGPSGADPNVPPPVIASAAVPSGAQRCIVVIAPAEKNATTPYRAIAFDDSRQAFPYGEARIVNFTPGLLAVRAGSIKLPLPAGQVTALPEIKDVNPYNMAQTNFYTKSGNEWVAITERQLQYVKTLRRVFIASVSPHAIAPSVRTISDLEPVALPPQ